VLFRSGILYSLIRTNNTNFGSDLVTMNNNLDRIIGSIAVLGLVLFLASKFYFRLDLTEDQRFTLMPATQKLLKDLDRDVHINVYLHGDFPAAFERLENATRETLEEF